MVILSFAVVYFDQQTGTHHTAPWSKLLFFLFLLIKKKRKKNSSKNTQKSVLHSNQGIKKKSVQFKIPLFGFWIEFCYFSFFFNKKKRKKACEAPINWSKYTTLCYVLFVTVFLSLSLCLLINLFVSIIFNLCLAFCWQPSFRTIVSQSIMYFFAIFFHPYLLESDWYS